jgi:hypothetical protein
MKSKLNNRYEGDKCDIKETFRTGNANDVTNATERVNDLLKSVSSINSDNMKLSQRIVSLEEDRILKNNLIIQLDTELDYFIEENEMLKEKSKQIESYKNKTETYRNEAFDYCKDLNKKMRGFIDTV